MSGSTKVYTRRVIDDNETADLGVTAGESEGGGADNYLAVTGAGGSVGPALAAALLTRGFQVALLTRPGKERAALQRVAQLTTGNDEHAVAAFGVDLTDEPSMRAALSAADQRFGHVAALFNVAGGFLMRPATEAGTDDVEQMMARNFHTAVTATKAVLPGMLARRSGFVLAVGAGAASQASPGRTAYAAAKAALAAYFRSLSSELKGTGVSAGILHPMGTIDTPPNRQAMPNANFASWLGVEAVIEAALYQMSGGGRVPELELFAD